jgi:hypothetical protein
VSAATRRQRGATDYDGPEVDMADLVSWGVSTDGTSKMSCEEEKQHSRVHLLLINGVLRRLESFTAGLRLSGCRGGVVICSQVLQFSLTQQFCLTLPAARNSYIEVDMLVYACLKALRHKTSPVGWLAD